MKVLVTGASGFIGNHLARSLTSEGHEVVAHAGRGAIERVALPIPVVKGDLTVATTIEAFPPRIDAVVHLAHAESPKEFPGRARQTYATNVGATFALLEYARTAGARRFIFASTGNVYGHQPVPIGENVRLVPHDFHGVTKAAAETLVAYYARTFGTAILRLFAVYGPGQQRARLIPSLVEAVRMGRPVVVDTNGGFQISPTHVEDVVEVIARTLDLDGSWCVNVAGREAFSIAAIARKIATILGKEPSFQIVERAPVPDLVPDITLMRELFPPLPRVGFDEGLKQLLSADAGVAAGAR